VARGGADEQVALDLTDLAACHSQVADEFGCREPQESLGDERRSRLRRVTHLSPELLVDCRRPIGGQLKDETAQFKAQLPRNQILKATDAHVAGRAATAPSAERRKQPTKSPARDQLTQKLRRRAAAQRSEIALGHARST
jgi:hypothetical protein